MKRVVCDCTCADKCPQGKVGTEAKCVIWKRELGKTQNFPASADT